MHDLIIRNARIIDGTGGQAVSPTAGTLTTSGKLTVQSGGADVAVGDHLPRSLSLIHHLLHTINGARRQSSPWLTVRCAVDRGDALCE